MKKFKLLFATFSLLSWMCISMATAQVDARMLRHPDVSDSHITFSYAGDIWVMDKEGGVAHQLSSPEGQETFPRFSPDGSHIAFSGNYDGNTDVYVVPVTGGVPTRLTFHGSGDRLIDWHPDGQRLLFATSRESGRQRYNQFYLIGKDGGMADKLPVAYGEFACFSPDGSRVAFTDKTRVFRTWKRYRGGTAPDLFTFDLETMASENITDNPANDELPMWHSDGTIYYLSDRGDNQRYNLWEHELETGRDRQLTTFENYDVHFPSMGPDEIVFEAGGRLYLYDLDEDGYEEVNVEVITDQITVAPRVENVSDLMFGAHPSPDGKRVVVEARGELFSVPAEHGYIMNLSQSTGVAERYPAWSPDGKHIAFWSDRSGEYELTVMDVTSRKQKAVTNMGPGFRYRPYWSPDSKKIAFIDQSMTIRVYDMDENTISEVDQGKWMFHGGLANFSVSWSSDSRWMAYDRGMENRNSAIFLYNTESGETTQVTSGYYSDSQPVFDPEGKYLYLLTNRYFRPLYSDLDNSFVYPNSTHVAAVTLRKDVPSPLAPRNDAVEVEEEKKDENGEEKDKEEMDKKEKKGKKNKKKDKGDEEGDGEEAKEEEEKLEIDLDGFERRMVLLPPDAGNYTRLRAVKGKVIYHNPPNTGSGENEMPVKYWDLEEREEQTILSDANFYELTADGKKMLVRDGPQLGIVDIKPKQKIDKPLRTSEMEMTIDPKAEWRQIFNDAWRFERDYFYDENMHGVDWGLMRERYGSLIEDAVTRWDVNYVLGELIGELNASHTYRGGGDTESSKRRNVGYLGIDWGMKDGYFTVERIIRGAEWDVETKSPLDEPGVEISEGNYIFAVNGEPLDTGREPYASFGGLAGKTVQLMVGESPNPDEAKEVVVELMGSESRLRHLAWIEANRQMVDAATGGRVGYVYVRSTGRDGQNELVRQFGGQWQKDGLIIDERFNSGGQIPDRFIELLNRKPLAYWDVRDGQNWQWPPIANFGPKAMLINGWSGSGGDAFPDYFRKSGLGPLIGSRTWGGLIGISGAPGLIDGGGVTVPTFRMYDPDGAWFREGHGVDPDIEVREDPGALAKGMDTQLMKAVEWIKGELDKPMYKNPEHGAPEVR